MPVVKEHWHEVEVADLGSPPVIPVVGEIELAAHEAAADPHAGYQAEVANLTALAGLTLAADRLLYSTGVGVLALATLSAFARTLLDDANAAASLTTLGVSAFVQTVLDDANAAAVRTTIGAYAPPSIPVVPATPSAQDIVDALKTLNLVTQAP